MMDRKRSSNWSDDQLRTLTALYSTNKQILDGKLSSSVTSQTKKLKWASIADQVSSLGPERNLEQCKKKIADLKTSSKAKAARISQYESHTGGGPACNETLTPFETEIVAKMPEVTYKGIPGGIDSSKVEPAPVTNPDDEVRSIGSTVVLADLELSNIEVDTTMPSTSFLHEFTAPLPRPKPSKPKDEKHANMEAYMEEMISSSQAIIVILSGLAKSTERIANCLEKLSSQRESEQ